jgi:hypothetical protein
MNVQIEHSVDNQPKGKVSMLEQGCQFQLQGTLMVSKAHAKQAEHPSQQWGEDQVQS